MKNDGAYCAAVQCDNLVKARILLLFYVKVTFGQIDIAELYLARATSYGDVLRFLIDRREGRCF